MNKVAWRGGGEQVPSWLAHSGEQSRAPPKPSPGPACLHFSKTAKRPRSRGVRNQGSRGPVAEPVPAGGHGWTEGTGKNSKEQPTHL